MKKIFTLICALAGFASMSSAASVDDVAPLKHSYVLVCDEWNNNGTEKIIGFDNVTLRLNEASAIQGVQHEYTPQSIFDLQGRKLSEAPHHKGVYVVDGKKRIME